jgi:CRP-like cAMP-binding protein
MSQHTENHLLSSLTEADRAALEPHLDRIEMPVRALIEAPNRQIEHVYFPESGIVSVVVAGPKGREIEVGIIGRDGMTGLAVLLGDGRATHKTFVQIVGVASRIGANTLRSEFETRPLMQQSFLRYAHAFAVQTSHTALANGQATLQERLARWLLMCLDRMDTNVIPLTHEYLAVMLGVRRAGVTETLGDLQRQGLVRCARGEIAVVDRTGLKEIAGGLYGIPEAEHVRLTGWQGKTAAMA